MKLSDLPAKFPLIWGASATSGYIRDIPVDSQIGITNGAASLQTGFPPLCFLPVGSGGVPPFGQDFNGILKQITAWSQWANAGGQVTYDADFASSIGGYPKGAVVAGTATGVLWLNIVDDNSANPDADGAGWIAIATSAGIQSGQWNYAADAGTINAVAANLTPALSAYVAGVQVEVKIANTNSGSATLNINGLGAKSILDPLGNALAGGELVAGGVYRFVYDGSNFQIATPTRFATDAEAAALATRAAALSPGNLVKAFGLTSGSEGSLVLPGGFKIIWGTYSGTTHDPEQNGAYPTDVINITLPDDGFPNTCFAVMTQVADVTSITNENSTVLNVNQSSFSSFLSCGNSGQLMSAWYIAIGN